MEISRFYYKFNIFAILKDNTYFCEINDYEFGNLFEKGLITYNYIKNNFKILDDLVILFDDKEEAQRFLDYLESLLVMEKLTE